MLMKGCVQWWKMDFISKITSLTLFQGVKWWSVEFITKHFFLFSKCRFTIFAVTENIHISRAVGDPEEPLWERHDFKGQKMPKASRRSCFENRSATTSYSGMYVYIAFSSPQVVVLYCIHNIYSMTRNYFCHIYILLYFKKCFSCWFRKTGINTIFQSKIIRGCPDFGQD